MQRQNATATPAEHSFCVYAPGATSLNTVFSTDSVTELTAHVLRRHTPEYLTLSAEQQLHARLSHAEHITHTLSARLQQEVLCDAHFTPFTDVQRPSSSVLWLRPSRELPYITSLHDLRVLTLWVRS